MIFRCESCKAYRDGFNQVKNIRIKAPFICYNEVDSLEKVEITTRNFCNICLKDTWVCRNTVGITCNNSVYDYDTNKICVNRCYICIACYAHNFVVCPRCIVFYNKNIDVYDLDSILELGNCVACNATLEATMIKENTYKPKPLFYKLGQENDITLFYGIELEVNCVESMGDNVLNTMSKQHVYLKYDGSIGVGFEIVTHPHSFTAQKQLWKQFFHKKFHLRGMTSYKSKRCGMHIHMSRKAFTSEHLARFVLFINNKDNISFITDIAQRKGNQWAKFDHTKTLDNLKPYGKYSAVNLEHKNTIEIRIFRGSVRKDRFFKNLEFVDSIYHYTDNNADLNYLTYIDWLKNHRKNKYPYLFKFLKEKDFIEEEGVECQTKDSALTV